MVVSAEIVFAGATGEFLDPTLLKEIGQNSLKTSLNVRCFFKVFKRTPNLNKNMALLRFEYSSAQKISLKSFRIRASLVREL